MLVLRTFHPAEQTLIDPFTGFGGLIGNGQVLNGMSRAVEASGKPLVAAADGHPVDAAQVNICRQHAGDGGAAAVDLLGKPDQLRGRADLIHAVLLRRLHRRLHGNGTLRLRGAAGGGDGGAACLDGGDNTVRHGGDLAVRGRPCHRLIGGVLRQHRGGQLGGIARIQSQRRLIQRYLRGGNRLLHRDGALRLRGAAGHGDGRIALLDGGDNAVRHGGHRGVRGRPHQRIGGVLRRCRGGQLCGLGRSQGQCRLVQRHTGGGNRLHRPLDKQIIGCTGRDIHNRQIRDLAVGHGSKLHQLLDLLAGQRCLIQLRSGQGKGIGSLFIQIAIVRVTYHQERGIRDLNGHGIAAVHGDLIGGTVAIGAVHLRDLTGGCSHLHGDGRGLRHLRLAGGILLKPHRHIVIGEIGGLGEAVAVVAGAGDVEGHLIHLAQAGQIPLRPVHDDVLRAIAQIDPGRTRLFALGIVAGGHQLHPVALIDLGGQAVAVDVAIQGIGGVGNVHMVDDMLRSICKSQCRQVFGFVKLGTIHVAEMHGEIVGAVVAAAGAGQAGSTGLINGKLCKITAVGGYLLRIVVGNGVAAAPIAIGFIIERKHMGKPCVVLIRPLVGLLEGAHAATLAVQQRAAVLGIVDQAGPVFPSGKIGAALIIRVLKGQRPQLVLRFRLCLRKSADRQQRYRHHQRQQQREDPFLHLVIFLSLFYFYQKGSQSLNT